ncbi:PQQ-binding-like beta-propeller repeat protein [Engelhardtia mirabilis]|uniref:Outer membrane protein assembly factor BamB n=1 Tax=Engelhardtia mirabilis TaxID=2528011 RepID=A0A518BHD8_9BACT|nr:Outer membrane protein assembly factor BamB [Planctomycetes bacterium Pla133]QDV00724.1 Outer membrane protein assembly factor BamB [Planctomycetes bacterium Pla86]
MLRATLSSALLIPLAASAALAQTSPWPTVRHDNQRTGRSPVIASQTSDVLYPELTIGGGTALDSEPVVGADGTVYLNTFSILRAIDPASGAQLWSVPNAGKFTTVGPDGRLYVASGSLGDTVTPGYVRAYQPDGTLDWTFTLPTPGGPRAPVTVAPDGTIYGSSNVYTSQSPVLESSVRFALDPAGNLLWNSTVAGQPTAMPMSLSTDGRLYQTGGDQRLRRIDPNSGAILWSVPGGAFERVVSPPLIHGDLVIVCATKGGPVAPTQALLVAFDADTGAVVWSVPFGGPFGIYSVANAVASPVLLANGDVVAFWNKLYRVSPTGQLVSSIPFPTGFDEWSVPVAGADDTLYTWTGDDKVIGFSPVSGAIKFIFNPISGQCITGRTPLILGDGSVFITWQRKTVCENFASTTRLVTLAPSTVLPCDCSQNLPPVASITGEAVVPPFDPKILDGSASADPEGGPLLYEWREILTDFGGALGPILSTDSTLTTSPHQNLTKTYRLKVTDCCDEIDVTTFAQTSTPAGVVTAPALGETWIVGQVHTVKWVPTQFSTAQAIQVSRDGGPWEDIVLQAPNTGSYNWTVTGPTTQNAVVRVFPGDPFFAHSSEPFEIATCQTSLGFAGPGELTLTICGDQLATGGTATLTVAGAPASTLAWLAVGTAANPTPLFGGNLVPSPPQVLVLGLTDLDGVVTLGPLQGGIGPATVYAQAIVLNYSAEVLVAFSNALQVEYLP